MEQLLKPVSDKDIKVLWEMQDLGWVDSALYLLYSGWRISELLDLRTDAVNLEKGTVKGGANTKAGKDRIVPIHSKVRHIVERRVQEGSEYLFSHNEKQCEESTYREFWSAIMGAANMQHTPHACRHTFRLRLDSAGADRTCIRLIMGDVRERDSAHRSIDDLKSAIELVTD